MASEEPTQSAPSSPSNMSELANDDSRVRGSEGYLKLDNGLMDVTPIGAEVAIYDRNATESPLLRLPPELRNVIWKHAVQGVIIASAAGRKPNRTSRLDVLRVCRQSYAETVVLCYAHNKFCFTFGHFFERLADNRSFQFIQHVRLLIWEAWAGNIGNDNGRHGLVRWLQSIKSLELVVFYHSVWDMARLKRSTERHLHETFHNPHFEVFYLHNPIRMGSTKWTRL